MPPHVPALSRHLKFPAQSSELESTELAAARRRRNKETVRYRVWVEEPRRDDRRRRTNYPRLVTPATTATALPSLFFLLILQNLGLGLASSPSFKHNILENPQCNARNLMLMCFSFSWSHGAWRQKPGRMWNDVIQLWLSQTSRDGRYPVREMFYKT